MSLYVVRVPKTRFVFLRLGVLYRHDREVHNQIQLNLKTLIGKVSSNEQGQESERNPLSSVTF